MYYTFSVFMFSQFTIIFGSETFSISFEHIKVCWFVIMRIIKCYYWLSYNKLYNIFDRYVIIYYHTPVSRLWLHFYEYIVQREYKVR